MPYLAGHSSQRYRSGESANDETLLGVCNIYVSYIIFM